MLRALRIPLCCLFLLISSPSFARSCIWFGDSDTLNRVDSVKNQIELTINLRNTQHLAMNASDCGVWVVADKHLHRFDAAGVQVSKVPLTTIDSNLDAISQLIVDPYDDSVWISDGRAIFHVGVDTSLIKTWSAPGEARSIAVSLNGDVWVLGLSQLWRYGYKGNLLETRDVTKLIGPAPTLLVLDDIRKILWLTGGKKLVQMPLGQVLSSLPAIDLEEEAYSATLNPFTGELWLVTNNFLRTYSAKGGLSVTVDLRDRNNKLASLKFDPISRSVWSSAERSASRFSAQGKVVAEFPSSGGVTSVATPTFSVRPTVSLMHPAQDAALNNPRPEIRYALGALCNGSPCGFPPIYFASYKLTAMLNQTPITRIGFEIDTGTSIHYPMVGLPEGKNTLSAQVQDGFGRMSDLIENTFVIDTVAPKITALAAAEGDISSVPVATLRGVVDDVTAVVVVEGVGQVTDTHINGDTLVFNHPVPLQLGTNSFTVSAIDQATNSGTKAVQVSYQPSKPLLSIEMLSPLNGTAVRDSTVLVRGTFDAPPNTSLTVNGVGALHDGMNFFAQVPLKIGTNVLTVTATTLSGASVTEILHVISEGLSPIEVSANPGASIAPFLVDFAVQNNTDRSIKKIEADFDGDGQIDFSTLDPTLPISFTYTVPGTYQARFRVTDGYDVTVQKIVMIVVEDPAQIDGMLKAQWAGLIAALSSGDKEKSTSYFNRTSRKKYGDIFDKIMPGISSVFSSASPLQKVSLSRRIGEYAVNRTAGGVNKIFFVYFLRDDDGVWRIDSL